MKLLLLLYQDESKFWLYKDNSIDYVFSLNEQINISQIAKVYSRDVLQHEGRLGKKLFALFPEVRELFTDFVAKWGNVAIDPAGRTFKDLFQWNGIALWWISNLVKKDPEIENEYFYRLVYLFFIKRLIEDGEFQIYVASDDRDFIRATKINFRSVYVRDWSPGIFKRIAIWLELRIFGLARTVLRILQILIFKFSVGKGCLATVQRNKYILFATRYPLCWIRDGDGMVDKNFSTTPFGDSKFGENSAYLVSCNFPAKQLFRFSAFKSEMESLINKARRPVVFLDSFLRLSDLLRIHFNWWQRLIFWRLKGSVFFKKTFQVGGLNVRSILIPELNRSFEGTFQHSQEYGASFKRFLNVFESPQIIVTYVEFMINARIAAHCIKWANPANQFISIQHAMNCRNKMMNYHRKEEFSQSKHWDSIRYSPMPDYYFSQGEQYNDILTTFYPEEKVRTIGCVKYDIYVKTLANRKNIENKCKELLNIKENQFLILLAPSLNDVESIFHILKGLKLYPGFRILLAPHPALSVNQMKQRQLELGVDHNIEYVDKLKTWELLSVVDLVVCGYSTVVLEASMFGVPSIRACGYKKFPLFSQEPEIPCFHDSTSFSEWLNGDHPKKHLPKLAERYFFKLDGKADIRFWQNILSITKK